MAHACAHASCRSDEILTGAAVGLVGGLLAGFVMNRASRLFDLGEEVIDGRPLREPTLWEAAGPRAEAKHEEPATAKAAAVLGRAVLHRPLSEPERKAGGLALHYAFAGASGALYGGVAAAAPAITAGRGMLAGALIWLAADEVAVPALGLARPPHKQPPAKHLQMLFNHLVFGAFLESFRKLAMSLLRPRA